MTGKALAVLRDRKADRPEVARSILKAISRVFDWAMDSGIQGVTQNPSRDAKYPKSKGRSFHAWSLAEVAQYEATHPIGSKARLAMELMLFTGQRKGDIILFGHRHIYNGMLTFTQQKNADRNPVALSVPVLPVLQDIINATPTGPSTFLVRTTVSRSLAPALERV